MVYGDYDVDGTTSVALMSTFLLSYYDQVTTYIPDRYLEGYGVSIKGIDYAVDNDISLIIALDCGIKAIEKVDYAKEHGVDFIICDHHRPGKNLPQAIAVLDPKRDDCPYPYKELCGCGVGFKLIQALASRHNLTIEDLVPYMDLVATAIGADIVPITGENRILAYHGLQVINTNPRPGFKAIIENIEKEILTITDVVFIIAPRINAAGRMKHALHAVDLMIENDIDRARMYAGEIETHNNDRRDLDQSTATEALAQIEQNGEQENWTSVVFNKHWHKGVIGIVASRLIETYHRPTLVFTRSQGDTLAASARSVRGFDVYNALEQCSEYIEQFGGHKYAAGLTLKIDQYEAFKKRFEEVVCATMDKRLLTREITADLEIDFPSITQKFYRILSQMAPFGPGNMTPIFLTKGAVDSGYSKCVGKEKDHLKVALSQKNARVDGIGFSMGDYMELLQNNQKVDIMYSLDENVWNGKSSIQMRLRDLRITQ